MGMGVLHFLMLTVGGCLQFVLLQFILKAVELRASLNSSPGLNCLQSLRMKEADAEKSDNPPPTSKLLVLLC